MATATKEQKDQHDALVDAIANATTWADVARALGKPGKRVRDISRNVFGTYKSRGVGTFDARTRAYVVAYMLAEGDMRKRIVEAFGKGDPLPPTK